MVKIDFNAAFRTDKAGRAANQDNGFCILNLADQVNGSKDLNTDRTMQLGPDGALFVVADGMGGMNAGEKASELIVKGVQRAFAKIPQSVAGNPDAMTKFMVDAIATADADVKAFAAANPQTQGMGSTIVALWIYNDIAVTAWVGDSRIYRFNPQNGLVRLSHDHSYVQSLVDSGRLPEHMAFDHPDSNIITRSLGDNGESARVETHVYKIYDGDEFLLCSDGLCGLLTDEETEAIMEEHPGSSKTTLDALWAAGEKKGWSDNATIEVVCVTGELPAPGDKPDGYPVKTPVRSTNMVFGRNRNTTTVDVNAMSPETAAPAPAMEAPAPVEVAPKRKSKGIWYLIVALVVICLGVGAAYYLTGANKDEKPDTNWQDNLEDLDYSEIKDAKTKKELEELDAEWKELKKMYEAYNGKMGNMDPTYKGTYETRITKFVEKCKVMLDRPGLSDEAKKEVKKLLMHGQSLQTQMLNSASNEQPSNSQPQQSNTSKPGKQPATQQQQQPAQQQQQQPTQQQQQPAQQQQTPPASTQSQQQSGETAKEPPTTGPQKPTKNQ